VLLQAYQRAGFDPADVQLIEGQGIGTATGDSAELAALTQLRRGGRDDGTVAALGAVSGLRPTEGVDLVLRREAETDRWAGRRRRADRPAQEAAGAEVRGPGAQVREAGGGVRGLTVREGGGRARVFVLRGGDGGARGAARRHRRQCRGAL
jgi:hypothetical protein